MTFVNLLLLSNSANTGHDYLEHDWPAVLEVLDDIAEVLFVPHDLADRDAYTSKARSAIAAHGAKVRGVHTAADPAAAISERGSGNLRCGCRGVAKGSC